MDSVDSSEEFRRRHSPVPNLSGRAFQAVFERIVSRRLQPGECIVESKLAPELGISRTPLREALQRLEGEGMVIKNANRSYTVRQVTLPECIYSLRVRELLEGEAAALAAPEIPAERVDAVRNELERNWSEEASQDAIWRLDDMVHSLTTAYCGNPVMAQLIRQVRTTTRLYATRGRADRGDATHVEHLRILDALVARDPKAARKAMVNHIRSNARRLLGALV